MKVKLRFGTHLSPNGSEIVENDKTVKQICADLGLDINTGTIALDGSTMNSVTINKTLAENIGAETTEATLLQIVKSSNA